MNQPYFLLPYVDPSPHGPLCVVRQQDPSTVFIDNFFAHFDDFSLKNFISIEKQHLLPDDALKFVLTFIHMPMRPIINLSKEHVQKIKNDDTTYLLLWSALEHVVDIQALHKALHVKGIPATKTIVLCSNTRLHMKNVKGITFVDLDFWESYSRHHQKMLVNSTEITIEDRLKTVDTASKKYLSLNRNVKPHRIWFYYAYLKYANKKESHVSYHLPTVDRGAHINLCEQDIVLKFIPEELKQEFAYYSKRLMLPKRLDSLDNRFIINYKNTIKSFYTDSLYSVITESDFQEVFITEKTFKAIVHCHPFFILGNRQHHNYLRHRGYKTFEDLFEINAVENFNDAKKLLENLNNMDLSKMKQTVKKEADALEHNFNLFYSRHNSWNTVVDNLVKATRSN